MKYNLPEEFVVYAKTKEQAETILKYQEEICGGKAPISVHYYYRFSPSKGDRFGYGRSSYSGFIKFTFKEFIKRVKGDVDYYEVIKDFPNARYIDVGYKIKKEDELFRVAKEQPLYFKAVFEEPIQIVGYPVEVRLNDIKVGCKVIPKGFIEQLTKYSEDPDIKLTVHVKGVPITLKELRKLWT